MNATIIPADLTGTTVTLNVPGAWHHGRPGVVRSVDTDRGLAEVAFHGHGTVRVPIGIVAPLPSRYL